jgi:hypothetical protein
VAIPRDREGGREGGGRENKAQDECGYSAVSHTNLTLIIEHNGQSYPALGPQPYPNALAPEDSSKSPVGEADVEAHTAKGVGVKGFESNGKSAEASPRGEGVGPYEVQVPITLALVNRCGGRGSVGGWGLGV